MNRITQFKIISYTDTSSKSASEGAERLLNEWVERIQNNPPEVAGDQPVKMVEIVSATPTLTPTHPHISQMELAVRTEQEYYTVTILVQYTLYLGQIRL